MKLVGFYIPFFISVVPTIVTVASYIRPKQSTATRTEGSSFLFKWDFHLDKKDQRKLNVFIFGLWEDGQTTYFLITVTKQGRVIYNPQLNEAHPSYVGRVTWAGDISKSYLAYKLVNLTLSDSNTYGCEIDVRDFHRTIHSKITLNVQPQARSTSKTPELNVSSVWDHTPNGGVPENATAGSVTTFNSNIEVSHGVPENATAGSVTTFNSNIVVSHGVPENATAGSVTTFNSNIVVSHGKAGSAKSKWELGFEYLPYMSILAIPAFLWAVTSKLRKRSGVNKTSANENETVPQYQRVETETVPMVPVPSWEFPKENLTIERVVGHGAFGVVSKGYARYLQGYTEWKVVAVKSLQEGATDGERRDLLSELNLLKKLEPHPHVITLLGCITEEKENPYVIIEYVPYGDLLGYLRRSRGLHDCYYEYPEIKPATYLTSEQILTFAWQIADGMQYISSKRIIHRDLAARNVLVGENLRCKITDFGMARDVDLQDIYIPRNQGRIPVKWTAIEAMTGRMEYSTKSDVWSFGIVLYEICTIGAEPYPGISPYKIPRVLQKGYRIPKPDYFKDELYNIMLNCWETDPEIRPSFEFLCSSIRGLQKSNQNYVNVQDCLETHQSKISV